MCKWLCANKLHKCLEIAHNPEAAGSNPTPATNVKKAEMADGCLCFFCFKYVQTPPRTAPKQAVARPCHPFDLKLGNLPVDGHQKRDAGTTTLESAILSSNRFRRQLQSIAIE